MEEAMNSRIYSKDNLENGICVGMGGRISDENINGKDKVTSGVQNYFDQCTQTA